MRPLALGLGAAVAGALAAAFLIAPEQADKALSAPFYGRNFAHRGLHTEDKSVPENSLPAFARAAALGYGVELDVQLTGDGALVVFHDSEVSRLCGREGKIENLTLAELRALRLCGTEHGIPLLSEALEVLGPDCPVIVELKRGSRNPELCEKTCETLRQLGGTCCVESFDPRIVAWFRKNAPEFLRGQLSAEPGELSKDTSFLNALAVGNLLTNVLARPHFIAYRIGKKPLSVKLCALMGAMKVAWTSRSAAVEAENDAVIFEHYRPLAKYK